MTNALQHLSRLAMTQFEDMDDYDSLKLILSGVEDIVERISEQLEELEAANRNRIANRVDAW